METSYYFLAGDYGIATEISHNGLYYGYVHQIVQHKQMLEVIHDGTKRGKAQALINLLKDLERDDEAKMIQSCPAIEPIIKMSLWHSLSITPL